VYSVRCVEENKIRIQEFEKLRGQKVFVYGQKITDFKAVDYMQMFAMCMGALQKTIERVDVLEAKLAASAQ
jgi:hypothetical protein